MPGKGSPEAVQWVTADAHGGGTGGVASAFYSLTGRESMGISLLLLPSMVCIFCYQIQRHTLTFCVAFPGRVEDHKVSVLRACMQDVCSSWSLVRRRRRRRKGALVLGRGRDVGESFLSELQLAA